MFFEAEACLIQLETLGNRLNDNEVILHFLENSLSDSYIAKIQQKREEGVVPNLAQFREIMMKLTGEDNKREQVRGTSARFDVVKGFDEVKVTSVTFDM